MTDKTLVRVSTKHTDFAEDSGGGFKFPENSRICITGAVYERRHQDKRVMKDGREIAAKDDTILKLTGVVPGMDGEELVHELGAGKTVWPNEEGQGDQPAGTFTVAEPGTKVSGKTGLAYFRRSLVRVGVDGSFTEEDDDATDIDTRHLIGMEFQTGYQTIKDEKGKIQDYTTLVATAVFVRPGGGAAEEDTLGSEIAEAVKAAVDAAPKPISRLALNNLISKSLSAEAKAVSAERLSDQDFIDQGVAGNLWSFDKKAMSFGKATA